MELLVEILLIFRYNVGTIKHGGYKMMDSKEIIQKFLSVPITSADGVLAIFAQLPGAIMGKGEQPLERFVYIPGTRKDRVVLIAHADTVWDNAYGKPQTQELICEDGVFRGNNASCGIGADDRAGCAMVWALRNSGHSLLIVDGEEKGKHGAKYLRRAFPKLYKELNRHKYMMEFDWAGAEGCLYNQVDNTAAFKKYIEKEAGFTDSHQKGGCDLQILCQKICGVNMSVGWHNCHKNTEYLDVSQWEQTYHAMDAFLQKPQKRFPVSVWARLRRFLGKVKRRIIH